MKILGFMILVLSPWLSYKSKLIGMYFELPVELQGTSWAVFALFGVDWMVRK